MQNLSGDASQEYFADGLTEAVIGYLTSIRALHVISRTSVMQFKGTHQSVPEIARKLSVDAVVEGSVLRTADRVRVHVQMIRGQTDEHVWSATYDSELRDVLTLETQIAFAIARQVQITVTAEDDGRTVPRAIAADVYDNYLKGRFALNRKTRLEPGRQRASGTSRRRSRPIRRLRRPTRASRQPTRTSVLSCPVVHRAKRVPKPSPPRAMPWRWIRT